MKKKGLSIFVSLVLLCFLAQTGSAASFDFRAEAVAEDVFLVSGPAGNTVVARDEDGLVLVDGVPEGYAIAYLDFISKETGTNEIKTLVNTHWHAEVTGLNQILGREGVDILAHENTGQWLGTTIRQRGDIILHEPMPAHALPARTFHTRLEQPFRDGRIVYGYMPQAHTDGDIYVFFPERNVLVTGGVLRSDGWTVVDLATNGFLGKMLDAYEHLLTEVIDEETVIVPSSGPVLSKAEFTAIAADYRRLMTDMVALLRKSQGPREVIAINPAKGLRAEWGNPAEFLDQSFRSFYGHLRESEYVGAMP